MFSHVNDQLALGDCKLITEKNELKNLFCLKDYWISFDHKQFSVHNMYDDEIVHNETIPLCRWVQPYNDSQFYDCEYLYEMKDGKLSKTRHAVDGGVIHINTQGHKLVNKYDKVVNKYDKPRHTKVYVGDDKYIQLKNRIPEYSVNFARRNTLFTYNERSQEITPLCKSSAFGDCDTFELNNNSLVTFHTGDPFARSGKQYVTLWDIRFMKHHIWKFPNYPHETTKLTRDYLFFLGECGKINYFSIYDSERVYELGVHAHGRVHPSSNGIWVFYSGYCDGGKLNFINHHGLDRNKGYVERFRYIWKY